MTYKFIMKLNNKILINLLKMKKLLIVNLLQNNNKFKPQQNLHNKFKKKLQKKLKIIQKKSKMKIKMKNNNKNRHNYLLLKLYKILNKTLNHLNNNKLSNNNNNKSFRRVKKNKIKLKWLSKIKI